LPLRGFCPALEKDPGERYNLAMTTWFTSDEHYAHANIIRYCARPFADVEEMEQELIARHNARVRADDHVYHLGDFSLDERIIKRLLPRLSGKHTLICGNHDKCHPCHKKYEAAARRYVVAGFTSVIRELTLGRFLLNHMPYTGDSLHEARYPEWRPKDEGAWLFHGHVHEAWKVRDRMINVGVDQWDYAPVSLEELEKLAIG
jgi:calcineurin-like phosphoesterase family protein